MRHSVLYHPDCTVGSGITPDLLTSLQWFAEKQTGIASNARGLDIAVITAGGELHPAPRTHYRTNTQLVRQRRECITVEELLPAHRPSISSSIVRGIERGIQRFAAQQFLCRVARQRFDGLELARHLARARFGLFDILRGTFQRRLRRG